MSRSERHSSGGVAYAKSSATAVQPTIRSAMIASEGGKSKSLEAASSKNEGAEKRANQGARIDKEKAKEQRKADKAASKEAKAASKYEEDDEDEYRLPTWGRVVFWLFRKSIVPVIMVVMLLVGMYAGYIYLGKGAKEDVFHWETWKHMYDLVFAES